jgi:hypothetical protein
MLVAKFESKLKRGQVFSSCSIESLLKFGVLHPFPQRYSLERKPSRKFSYVAARTIEE